MKPTTETARAAAAAGPAEALPLEETRKAQQHERFRRDVAEAHARMTAEHEGQAGPPAPPRPLQCRMRELVREFATRAGQLHAAGNQDGGVAAEAMANRLGEVLREWAVDAQAFAQLLGFTAPPTPGHATAPERAKPEKAEAPAENSPPPADPGPWILAGMPVEIGATYRHKLTNSRLELVTASRAMARLELTAYDGRLWTGNPDGFAEEFDSHQPAAAR